MHCNFRPPAVAEIVLCFKYEDHIINLKSVNVSVPDLLRFTGDALRYAVTLTFYL